MEKDIKLFKFYKEGILKSPKGSQNKDKKVSLYKLNIQSPENPLIGYSLPPQYIKILDDAVFVLSRKAIDTIEYLLNEAPVQRRMPLYYGYDTSVREVFMEIGNEFFHKAVYLLCDYYYNEKTQYYSRNEGEVSNHTLEKLIIYKFWQGRTGRGMQYINSGFNLEKFSHNLNNYYVSQQIKHFESKQEKEKFEGEKGFIESKQEKEKFEGEKGSIESFGKVIKQKDKKYSDFSVTISFTRDGNSAIVKYRTIVANKRQAETVSLNSFYKQFESDYRLESPIIIIDEIKIKQNSKEKLSEAKFFILDRKDVIVGVSDLRI